jgi:class 3 adenylate cyclase/predicted ATPase
MFCDLVGSTELAGRLDPEDLGEVIGTFHRAIANVITAFGGFVARYIGDSALIYFGYPSAHEDDAERAIRAGLQAVETVSRLAPLHGHKPQVRIGIATGLVVVGDIVGTGVAPEQDVAGETPNLAARLQAVAEPNAIVIAANTRRLAGGLFEYRDLGTVALKGFSEPVPAWQVLGASTTEGRFEAQHETELIPMVGRDEEIELLLSEWRQAREGRGKAVLLSGEPGIGKSRLTAMLSERLTAEPHIRLSYFCSPHKQGSPLYPCITQLEHAAGFARDDSPIKKLDKLDLALAPGKQHAEDFVLIADLLSLPADDRYPKLQLTPQKRKERTMQALLRQLTLLSQQRPLLMIFEDAQWVDPSTHDLLDLTVKQIANLRILLIITFRPEFRAEWLNQPHVSALTLRSLPRPQAIALVMEVAGKNVLPDDVIDDIVERTDGVPLFLEELTKAVMEAGAHEDAAHSVISRTSHHAFAVPTTLHASLTARLDRIGPAKEIAQIGAAIGREFSYELLSAVAQWNDVELQTALRRLTGAGLVFRRGMPPNTTYLFKHALVQDAAYASLLRATRKALNQKIAEVLESTFPEVAATQPELIAHHCTEAGLAEKALGYWLKAGQQAMARSAMVEAMGRLQKGLDLIASIPDSIFRRQQELELRIALGKALIATKGYAVPATINTFARARQLCEELNQPPQLVSVLHGQWTNSLMRADLASARRRADELLELGEARNDPIWKLMGCRLNGVTCFPLGEFSAAERFLKRGLELYDPAHRAIYTALTVDDAHVVMQAYLSWVLLYLGHLDQARKQRDEALAEARRLSHAYTLAHALNGFVFTELTIRSFETALQRMDQLAALTEEHAISYYRAMGTIFRGRCLAALGQGQDGIEMLTNGLAAYRATGTVLYLPTFLTWLADAYGKAQQPERGLAQLTEIAQLIESTQMRVDEAEMHRVRGELLISIDDSAAAAESFRAALTVSRRQGAKLWELCAATAFARLHCSQGNRLAAREILQPIYHWFTEGLDTPALREAKTLLDTLT